MLALALAHGSAARAAGADGAAAFETYCIACHGTDAHGVANLGVDLVASKFVATRSEAGLVEFLRQGRLPDDPATITGRPMPGFAWVTDGELKALAAYLKSLRGKG